MKGIFDAIVVVIIIWWITFVLIGTLALVGRWL